MQRIERINEADAPQKTAELLTAVKQKMGGVPNIIATMAQSPAALGGFLGFSGALGEGKLSAQLGEQIALTVAGANGCDYCASAHTAVAGKTGVSSDELARNLRGQSTDGKVQGALQFTSRIIDTRGHVSNDDLDAARRAGFSEEEIVEIVAHVALNIFTNYFNHVADTEIDFPVVKAGDTVAA